MLSAKQCELARVMTGDIIDDTTINTQYESVPAARGNVMFKLVDALLKRHDMPINEGLQVMRDDFAAIAKEFNISPATLFCIYMDNAK